MHIYIKILLFLIFIDFSWDLLNSSNNFKRSNSFKIGVVLATILILLFYFLKNKKLINFITFYITTNIMK